MGSCLGLVPKASDVFLGLLFRQHRENWTWIVKLKYSFLGKWLDKNLPYFGIIPLFKKESDCTIFHNLLFIFQGPANILGYIFHKW